MLFFTLPFLPVLVIYILAAVLPAAVLLRYIYRHDTVEKEPPGLLVRLLVMGVASALCSGLLELVGQTVLNRLVSPDSPYYTIILAFLVVALVEEGTKLLLLYRTTWRDPNFNYRFDGIVYAVFVSLGFAAYENIQYVFCYWLSVALPRALLAVPGHMSFAVVMGTFYGRAKLSEYAGDWRGRRHNLWSAYLSAVSLHGFYDACAMIGSVPATVLFILFVLWMFWMVYRMVRRESATDAPLSL